MFVCRNAFLWPNKQKNDTGKKECTLVKDENMDLNLFKRNHLDLCSDLSKEFVK